jgi:uncharacterized membrane protein
MVAYLVARWRNLLAGFWFVPGAVASLIAMSALLLIEIDRGSGERGVGVGFGGDAGAARDILATISGSLITVAGLTFSLTIVVLTLVSSQFTPRALRGFLGDRLNQVVAGSFVGMFVYCLLVMRTIRSEEGGSSFVPSLSVTAGIVFGVATLVLLLVFVHHMGQSIQASHITARIARQTLATVDRRHPAEYAGPGPAPLGAVTQPASVVRPDRPGFVQLVKVREVLRQLPPGSHAEIPVRVGDFVTERDVLLRVSGAQLDRAQESEVGRAVHVDSERELHDDEAYGIRQLADIALKALSPGINDATTAATCVGYLAAVLERLVGRSLPASTVEELDGAVLTVRHRTWEEYVEEAFDEIGRYAAGNARVVLLVLDALRSVGRAARAVGAEDRLPVLADVGQAVTEAARSATSTDRDHAMLASAARELSADLAGTPAVAAG